MYDFINRVNNRYNDTRDPNHFEKKAVLLAPLGLVEDEIKNLKLNNPCKYLLKELKNNVERELQFFDNRNRLSEIFLDNNFVDFLAEEYSDAGFNGYISNVDNPSRFHCGFFNREVCLFKPLDFISHICEISVENVKIIVGEPNYAKHFTILRNALLIKKCFGK